MSFNNLSKTFVYENELGESIKLTYDDGYLINKPNGIDTVAVSLNEAQGIGQTGSTVLSRNVDSRPITISGILCGANQGEHKDTLLSIVRPDLKGKLYADDFYLEVYPTATPVISPDPEFASFQFSLLAAYPYWQRQQTAISASVGYLKRFKFPWNISRSYQFGEQVETKFVYITNDGQVEVPYTVTFTAAGAVSNPKLIDAETNRYLLLNKTMVAGERVVVEITHGRTYVTSSVDGECRGALDLGSNFYRLSVGDTAVKPDADSGGSNLRVSIEFAVEKVGISV